MIEDVLSAHGEFTIDAVSFDEPMGWVVLLGAGLAILVGPWLFLQAREKFSQGYSIYANEPISASAVAHEDGIVEVEGAAKPLDTVLSAKYSKRAAVAYSWKREQRRETRDSDGNTQTEYRTVSQGSEAIPFLVEDETGTVAVDPKGCTLSINQSRRGSRNIIKNSPMYREYEGRIEPGDSVHVYGQKRTGSDAEPPGEDSYFIGNGDEVSEFVVSDASELRTVLRYFGTGIFLLIAAGVWTLSVTGFFLVLVEQAFGVPVASKLIQLFG